VLLHTLREARSLICSAERWIPRGFAEDADGRWRPVGSDDAVRFSVLGALVRVGGGSRELAQSARKLLQECAPETYARMASATLTHADALTMLDAAVARLAR
jgi:hypothetical protein